MREEQESEREPRDPVGGGEGNLSSLLKNRQLPPLPPATPANAPTSFASAFLTLPLQEGEQSPSLSGRP